MNQPISIIDLHCDTLTSMEDISREALLKLLRRKSAASLQDCVQLQDTLNAPRHQFALDKIPQDVRWAQCCAVFIPDSLSGEDAIAYYAFHRDNFYRQMSELCKLVSPCCTASDIETSWGQGKSSAILTIENGSALGGQLARVEQLRQDGVRMITLTWNGENELGSGHSTSHGLTHFGREAVLEMEKQGILVDVSHLNDPGFFDLLDIVQKPFVASHSNARAVCPHRRNLSDQQIREMVERKCLIGLNYYNAFLRSDGKEAVLEDLWRHVAHFLELGADDCLALGSDFDGADLPPCLNSPEKIAALGDYFRRRGLSPTLTEKILWRNALRFFSVNLV